MTLSNLPTPEHNSVITIDKAVVTIYMTCVPVSMKYIFTPGFSGVRVTRFLSFMCMFCRSLFVLLYFFFWPFVCLFFCDIGILITSLVSSNSSCFLFQCQVLFYNQSLNVTLLKHPVHLELLKTRILSLVGTNDFVA